MVARCHTSSCCETAQEHSIRSETLLVLEKCYALNNHCLCILFISFCYSATICSLEPSPIQSNPLLLKS